MMQRLIVLLLLIIGLTQLCGQSITSPAAQRNYDYRKALNNLLTKESSGLRNPDLYYNIGVNYYHLGQSGKATLYFLRALNLDSAHKPAQQNLEFIQSLDHETIKSPTRSFVSQVILRIYDNFSLNRLALLLLTLILMLALSAHWLLHYPTEKEKGLPVLVLGVVAFVFLLTATTYLVKHHRYSHNSKAVVISGSADIYASPNESRALQILPEASILQLQETSGSRTRVILADGFTGWMENNAFERVIQTKASLRRKQ